MNPIILAAVLIGAGVGLLDWGLRRRKAKGDTGDTLTPPPPAHDPAPDETPHREGNEGKVDTVDHGRGDTDRAGMGSDHQAAPTESGPVNQDETTTED